MTRRLTIKLPSLVSTKEFQPSGLMIRTLCAFLEALDAKKHISPPQILTALSKHSSNWYKWLKKDEFINWWTKAIEEYHNRIGLANVHNALYINALGNSPTDRKTYMERFDKNYKPATATEHNFKGIEPADVGQAVQRSRERAQQARQALGQSNGNDWTVRYPGRHRAKHKHRSGY
ncbi:hypothetical protein ES703_123075 [subsurface metagenome]